MKLLKVDLRVREDLRICNFHEQTDSRSAVYDSISYEQHQSTVYTIKFHDNNHIYSPNSNSNNRSELTVARI